MRASSFRGIESIQVIECSGNVLHSDIDLFGMTLFTPVDNKILASVNLKSNECVTSHSYSSCLIDSKDTRKTRLLTLVFEWSDDAHRLFGCNVTSFRASQPHLISWFIRISRKWMLCMVILCSQNACSRTTC